MPFTVDEFETHFKTRYVDIIVELANRFEKGDKNDPLSPSAFVIFQLCLNFFEPLGQFLKGEVSKPRDTVKFFKFGYEKVFEQVLQDKTLKNPYPLLSDDDYAELVKIARHGMAHTLIPNGSVSLKGNNNYILTILNRNEVVCDVVELPKLLSLKLDEFIQTLRTDKHAKAKAERIWGLQSQKCIAPLSQTTPNPAQL